MKWYLSQFLDPKVTSSNVLTFAQLEPSNVWRFCFKKVPVMITFFQWTNLLMNCLIIAVECVLGFFLPEMLKFLTQTFFQLSKIRTLGYVFFIALDL